MSAEYRYIDGTLRQGYFCSNCGESINMIGSGHASTNWSKDDPVIWSCKSNLTLVSQLHDANPPPGFKPHYILRGVTSNG